MNSRSPLERAGDEIPDSEIWQKALRIQTAASNLGFDWENLDDILEKLLEEAHELLDAQKKGERGAIVDELGDVLFVVSHYAWRAGIELEDALSQALAKFQLRFGLLCEELEREGLDMQSESIDSLEKRWQHIKTRLAARKTESGAADQASSRDRAHSPSTAGKKRP